MSSESYEGKHFALKSIATALQLAHPTLFLLLAFYSLASKQHNLGCIAALLGIQAYFIEASTSHLHWKGTTAWLSFAYLYAATKLGELLIVFLTKRTGEYDFQDSRKTQPRTAKERLMWATEASVNLRCIGLKCGKTEKPLPMPSKSGILVSAFTRLGMVDVLTSLIHHLACYNDHLPYIDRPIWQQFSMVGILGTSLFCVFQGTYGLLQYVGIYIRGQPPSQWPLMLLKPWHATSVRNFWSTQWHSVFRRIFTFYTDLIVTPATRHLRLSKQMQTVSFVMMVFLISGVFHDIGLWLTLGEHSWRTILFFVLQGVAVLVEPSVGVLKIPWVGWLWTYTFLCITAGPIGMVGYLTDHAGPGQGVFTDGFLKDVSITTRIINALFGTAL